MGARFLDCGRLSVDLVHPYLESVGCPPQFCVQVQEDAVAPRAVET
jgi:hypothetical protein